jgi:hypothetical protein
LSASVSPTCAHIAIQPICSGHIDKRKQDDVRCVLRSDHCVADLRKLRNRPCEYRDDWIHLSAVKTEEPVGRPVGGYSPLLTSAGVIALGCFFSPSRRLNDSE